MARKRSDVAEIEAKCKYNGRVVKERTYSRTIPM